MTCIRIWLPFYILTVLLLFGFAWGASIALVQRKQAARDRLNREKLQAVLETAGAVCHELNQPMQVIVGYCDLLLMDIEEEDVNYHKIKRIEKQIERMGSITLKLSKITKYETTDYLEDKIIDIEKSAL